MGYFGYVRGMRIVCGDKWGAISEFFVFSYLGIVPGSLKVLFAFVLIPHLYYSHRLQKILRIQLFLF